MASTTFSGPVTSTNGFIGAVTGNVSGVVTLTAYTVSTVPTAGAGKVIYVSNGANGAPVLAFSNASAWFRCDTLGALSAS